MEWEPRACSVSNAVAQVETRGRTWSFSRKKHKYIITLNVINLCRAAEDLVAPADTRTYLIVLRFCMTRSIELGLVGESELASKWAVGRAARNLRVMQEESLQTTQRT